MLPHSADGLREGEGISILFVAKALVLTLVFRESEYVKERHLGPFAERGDAGWRASCRDLKQG